MVAFTAVQIPAGHGTNSLARDGTAQTIAIVDTWDDPNIHQALEAFDLQFGLTASGSSFAVQ
jgi:subtilase family serine protease